MSRADAAAWPAADPDPPGLVRQALAYPGGLAILGAEALGVLRPGRKLSSTLGAALAQLVEVVAAAWPIVLLVHLSMGSFLSMQAYFGATFRDAAGAVVGLGLTRNLAPLLTGFILAGLFAVKLVPEGRRDAGSEHDAPWSAARILAAAVAGPVLAVWGVAAGLLSGMLVSRAVLGVAPSLFVIRFIEMIRPVDLLGLVVKGAGFAAASALFACFEGRRCDGDLTRGVGRAVCGSSGSILVLNSLWFTLLYLSGAPFGPGLALD